MSINAMRRSLRSAAEEEAQTKAAVKEAKRRLQMSGNWPVVDERAYGCVYAAIEEARGELSSACVKVDRMMNKLPKTEPLPEKLAAAIRALKDAEEALYAESRKWDIASR